MTDRKLWFRKSGKEAALGAAAAENEAPIPASENAPEASGEAAAPAEAPDDGYEAVIAKLRALLEAERADRAEEARRAEAGRRLRDCGLTDDLSDLVLAPTSEEIARRVERLRASLELSVKRELVRRIGTSAPSGGTLPRVTRETVRNLPLSELSDLLN